MSAITEGQLAKLRPYLAGPESSTGEIDMYCPFHQDAKASASVNLKKGLWYCHGGCGGGKLTQLFDDEEYWVGMECRQLLSCSRPNGNGSVTAGSERPSLRNVYECHQALVDNELNARDRLFYRRGITPDTIRRYKIGYDVGRRLYTLPVRDRANRLVNIRRYDLTPIPGRRKIWGLRGNNQPRLYPVSILRESGLPIIICEGEWDALLTIQNGFPALTRTGAARVWKAEWSELLAGRQVYVCHDCDAEGQAANIRVSTALIAAGADPYVVHLPFEIKPKHGNDLTDYWLAGAEPGDFEKLLAEAPHWGTD